MPTSSFLPIKCVLFDLDGTLLDTVPDLLAALNAVLVAEGREHFTLAQARHTVSHGSMGMLELAFGTAQSAADLQRRRETGMQTLIAEWGYLNANNEHRAWPADGSVTHPAELLAWLT